jgi:hypothetical protein
MTTLTIVIIIAVVVLVALYRKDWVVFTCSFFGARFHLEAKSRDE